MTYKGNICLDDKVIVSDPCYELGIWCQGEISSVLPGLYSCFAEYKDEGRWGIRVATIKVIHKDYVDKNLTETMESFEVGVDSGMAGIFGYDYYERYHDAQFQSWYDQCFAKTCITIQNPNYEPFDWNIENESIEQMMKRHDEYRNSAKASPYLTKLDANTIHGSGFVSSSGYGDGGYNCWTAKNEDGNVVSIRIEFISDDE